MTVVLAADYPSTVAQTLRQLSEHQCCLILGHKLEDACLRHLVSSRVKAVWLQDPCQLPYPPLPDWARSAISIVEQPAVRFSQHFPTFNPDLSVGLLLWNAPDNYRELLMTLQALQPLLAPEARLLIRTGTRSGLLQALADAQLLYPDLTYLAELQGWCCLGWQSIQKELPPLGEQPWFLSQLESQIVSAYQAWSLEAAADPAQAEKDGMQMYQAGEVEQADFAFRQAIRADPSIAEYWNSWGAVLQEQKRWTEAIDAHRQAVFLKPTFTSAWANLGHALAQVKREAEALAAFTQALSLDPSCQQALYNRGLLYQEQGRYREALTDYEQVLALDPDFAGVHLNQGIVLHALKQFEAARQALQRAMQLEPKTTPSDLSNLGLVLHEQGDLAAAVSAFDQALVQDPSYAPAAFKRGMSLLQMGQWVEGWTGYDARFTADDGLKEVANNYRQPRWQGEPLGTGHLLVWGEQGFGDHLQFCRYLKLLRQQHSQAYFHFLTQPVLLPLLKQLEDEHLKVRALGASVPPHDWQIPLLTLPRWLEPDPNALDSKPYLQTDLPQTELAAKIRQLSKRRIGLIWRSGKRTGVRLAEVYRHKSCPLQPLLQIREHHEDIALFSFQLGEDAAEIQPYLDQQTIFDLGDQLHNFRDTAAWMQLMDLIISVDTASAHVAGALGCPVWVLLPHIADWRWGQKGQQTPWYASMRLFRQPQRDDWEGAIHEIGKALQDF